MDDSMMPLSENSKLPQVYKMVDIQEGSLQNGKQEEMKMEEDRHLIGLTKEQLEEYRNDPFWRMLRYVMFALFWVLWIAMFVGAVALVVLSPKCVVKKKPEWSQKHISYQIFTPSFRDSNGDGTGDFNGIKEKLNELRKIGVETVWVTPVIATQKDDFLTMDVIDFSAVDERFGSKDELKSLIDATHKLDMHFTMDLPLTTTSTSHKWFASARQGGQHRDFYIWRKTSTVGGNTDYMIDVGTEFAYLVHDGKYPVLNWANPLVRDAIYESAKTFIDLGVDGFHLSYVSELMKQQSVLQGQAELATLGAFVQQLKDHIRGNASLNGRDIAIFTNLDDMQQLRSVDPFDYKSANLTYVVDNSATKLADDSCTNGISKCLYTMLIASLQMFERSELPYAWQFSGNEVSRLSTRFDVPTADLLTFVQLTLPGAAEIYYGQELSMHDANSSSNKHTGLMQWDGTAYAGFTDATVQPFFATTDNYVDNNFEAQFTTHNSSLRVFRTIAKLRQRDDNLVLGETRMAPLLGQTILFSRFHRANNKTSNAAYVIAANFGVDENYVDASLVAPSDRADTIAEVVATTPNMDKYEARYKLKLNTEKLTLGPKQGILLRI